MQKEVAIIIPIYKSLLKDYEEMSLKQCYKILGAHPVIFVKPASLDFSPYESLVDKGNCLLETFEDHFFENVQGYNRLMLSEEFYGRFLEYKFILIYQLDAFVFRDELLFWCYKGYDYIGAPWVEPYKWKRKVRCAMHHRLNRKQPGTILPTKLQFYNKVGNGGFSLRRVAKFHTLCRSEGPMIDFYNTNSNSQFFNEDVFWSLEVNRKKKRLKIPDYRTALHFSIEQRPELGMQLLKGELPFGAHGLYAYPDFWKRYLNRNEVDRSN